MPASEARMRANKKYQQKTYEPLSINVLQGERAVVTAAAQEAGMSMAAYVRAAIAEKMERDGLPEDKRLTRTIRDAKRPGGNREE